MEIPNFLIQQSLINLKFCFKHRFSTIYDNTTSTYLSKSRKRFSMDPNYGFCSFLKIKFATNEFSKNNVTREYEQNILE